MLFCCVLLNIDSTRRGARAKVSSTAKLVAKKLTIFGYCAFYDHSEIYHTVNLPTRITKKMTGILRSLLPML